MTVRLHELVREGEDNEARRFALVWNKHEEKAVLDAALETLARYEPETAGKAKRAVILLGLGKT